MRRTLLPSLMVGILIGVAGVAMTSASPRMRPSVVLAPGRLNPGIPSDAQLYAFGRAHPTCQLWTNWQKMCSRTGPNGTVLCVSDPDRPVAPSRPFCARPSQGDLTGTDAVSHDRFCASRSAENPRTRPGDCRRYRRDRPFNGFHLAARRSPLCRRWVDADTRRTICSEEGAGFGSCATVAATQVTAAPLACDETTQPAACQPSAEGIVRHSSSGIVASDLHMMLDWHPVNGLYCEGRN